MCARSGVGILVANVGTLLIGGQLDVSTPPQNATRELLPHLPNGHQVVLPKLGHTDDFWAYEPGASTRLIDGFLDSGRVDTSLYSDNRLEFAASVTHSRIAEIVVSVFLGFAGLVVFSLLWLARHLRRGAMFGRKSSFVARSLLPLMLGFGGWCLGVLIVLVALPTVPITDELLAVISIAPPVALVVYAGWLRQAAPRRVAAFTALSTAALGAWLGYQVPHGPGVGAVTAVVGATLAANLGLIALDIAASARARAAVPDSTSAATQPSSA